MDGMIYLDNAATSFPKPDAVHDKMIGFYRTCGVNPGRSGCDMALQAEAMVDGARRKLSALFNASLVSAGKPKDPARLVFTSNATHSLNLILKGTIGPGDHVITTWMEHNSVLRPVNHLVRLGAEATFVRPGADCRVDPDDIRRAIQPNTKLVIVNHGSNVCGVVQDIPAIGAVCRAAGVPLALDAAQTAGAFPIDMADWHVSFVAFTGHKSLLGPTGTGGICVADDAVIASTMWGGTGVRSVEPYHLEEYPWRLEAGTLNVLGIAGLSAGVDWISEHGLETIQEREDALAAMLAQGLREIRGVTVYFPLDGQPRVPTLSITVKGWDPSDVGTLLDVDHNILTRTGLQCAPKAHEHLGTAPRGTLRFSVGPLNTREDILAAIKAVGEIAAIRA
jgi:cysteine desulfurase / selenocysteine lyase